MKDICHTFLKCKINLQKITLGKGLEGVEVVGGGELKFQCAKTQTKRCAQCIFFVSFLHHC